MKTVIIYHSEHHGNTKKLVTFLAQKFPIKLVPAEPKTNFNLAPYDLVGFASGIYNGNFHETILNFAQKNLSPGQKTFLLYTHGDTRNDDVSTYVSAIKKVLKEKHAPIVGSYNCPGWDTAIGNANPGHPDKADLTKGVQFFQKISQA